MHPAPPRRCQRDSAETRTCVCQAVCYRCVGGSRTHLLRLYLRPYPALAPSSTPSHILNDHLRTDSIPRALDRPWTRPYEKLQAILRHSVAGPLLASRRQRLDIQQIPHVRRLSFGSRTLLRKRCRNRPVQHSRKACVRDSDDDLACLALRIAYHATGSAKRSQRDRTEHIPD
jgi:hypothetical protein